MKLGVFGGTFDPPHVGHLIAAQDVLVRCGLDRVIFIPAGEPPHKRNSMLAAAPIRLEMMRAAAGNDPRLAVDDLELMRTGPSYTVDTLRAYRLLRPDAALFLIIGADQFAELDTWHEAGALPGLATLVVMARADIALPPDRAALRPRRVDVTRVDVSSTEIRRRVAAGEPIRYLVPAAVEALILEHGLYARDTAETARVEGASGQGKSPKIH